MLELKSGECRYLVVPALRAALILPIGQIAIVQRDNDDSRSNLFGVRVYWSNDRLGSQAVVENDHTRTSAFGGIADVHSLANSG